MAINQSRVHRVMWSLLRTLGWIAASGALLAGLLLIELSWNLFDWSPQMDRYSFSGLLLCCASIAALYAIALWTLDRPSRIAALIICLILLVIGGIHLPSERIATPVLGSMKPTLPVVSSIESALARRSASPLWYRSARFGFLSVPMLIWLWARFRILRKRRDIVFGETTR